MMNPTPTTILTTILVVIVAAALTPVYAAAEDPRVGTEAVFSEIGMERTPIGMGNTPYFNMDVSQTEENEGEEEEKGNVGNQFVVKGHAAYSGTFQHQAAVLIYTPEGFIQICGAVLLSSRRALTSAHCTVYLYGNGTTNHFLAVAIHNRTMGLHNPGSQLVPISHAVVHRRYQEDKPGYPYDIAMLYMSEDIVQNDYVQFAELAKPEMGNFDHETCVISGWGYTTETNLPEVLQFGYQYVPTLSDCRLFWAWVRNNGITKEHICGYYYPTSSCFGDSGGPLTCGNVVAGIISWGDGLCSGCWPAINTRITSHYEWIIRHMQ